ncbi:MAG: LysM peptidoglycan-binding domain-containing protein [Microbacterium sp.]
MTRLNLRRPSARRVVPVAMTGAIAVTMGIPTAAVAADNLHTQQGEGLARSSFGNLALKSPSMRLSQVGASHLSTAQTAQLSSYTVVGGDTVTAIAIRHGLRTVDLLEWNKLQWSSVIFPGQSLTLMAPGTAATTTSAPASNDVTVTLDETSYTVVAGDTVWAIAQKFSTTIARILELNELDASAIIYPGQRLVVSSNKVSKDLIEPAANDPEPEPTPTTPDPEPSTSDTTYTVVAGDTLYGIAQKFEVTLSALLAANNLSADSIIYPGQKLTIPGTGSDPAPAEVPDDSSGDDSSGDDSSGDDSASDDSSSDDDQDTGSIYDGDEQLHATLNEPQTENAQMIISIGRELGVSDRGIAIALAASMVESSLRNVSWGDLDSLGLFQQRPSTGWGTEEQILDRDHAIRAFFGGPNDPNGSTTRGLLDIPNWESLDFGVAAQTVQVSAYPDRYQRWHDAAFGWLADLG